MRSPVLPTLGRDVPKVKRETGPSCFRHGSRTDREPIDSLMDTVCTDLTSRKLTWEHVNKELKDQYTNPTVTYNASLDGDPLLNVEQKSQTLTFVLYDQNGGNGGAAEIYMMKDYCKHAYQEFLKACADKLGEKGTSGGIWYSENGLVAYTVS